MAVSGAMLDFAALRTAPVRDDPFPHLILPGFIRQQALSAVETDFPSIESPGSLPLPVLSYGSSFAQMIEELRGPEMATILSDKFDIDLSHRPTMITVRGRCRATDGKIHTDSKTKLITVLLYMNGSWEHPGGRLRLLRAPDSLDNPAAEVPPKQGTLLVFRNRPEAWHGHESFEGPRRAIQLNWVRDRGVVWREQARHRLSALSKKIFRKS